MSASTLFTPSLSLLGPGALRRLGPIIAKTGAKTALVITGDRRFDVTGVIPELTRMLNRIGTKVEVYDEIEQNPTTQHVQAALIMAEEIDADCVVSVGGGSCHDCAKLVRGLLQKRPGQTTVEELEGVDMLLSAPSVPHFAVSTTATSGSSSELSRLAIIDDPIAKTEMSVIDHGLAPTVACVVTASSQGRRSSSRRAASSQSRTPSRRISLQHHHRLPTPRRCTPYDSSRRTFGEQWRIPTIISVET